MVQKGMTMNNRINCKYRLCTKQQGTAGLSSSSSFLLCSQTPLTVMVLMFSSMHETLSYPGMQATPKMSKRRKGYFTPVTTA